MIFENITLAETDEALRRLEELLSSHIYAVITRLEQAQAGDAPANRDSNSDEDDPLKSLKKEGQQILKEFEGKRRAQRRRNQHLARVRSICEAQLVGRWLTTEFSTLAEVFNAEPAAFIFRSTVPLAQPEESKRTPPLHLGSSQPGAKSTHEEEGVLRSLFRWLFG